MDRPSPENQFQLEHVQLLVASYRRWLGRDLVASDTPEAAAQAIYEAPFVVVSHDTAEDPIFNYGNLTALRLFAFSWDGFTSLPSRESAEPLHRDERARLLDAVSRQNYIDDYSGIRVSSSGRRFRIPQAVVWNLRDDRDRYRGQAATFEHWEFLD